MGADIFESFVGSIIAAMVIAAANTDTLGDDYLMIPIVWQSLATSPQSSVFLDHRHEEYGCWRSLAQYYVYRSSLVHGGGYFALDYMELDTTVIQAVAIGSIVGNFMAL
ncbi:MAG: hypothetical protein Ct9H90mP16_18910 [Candidatus Poseidoniales archaeon]|nr:MAG: hypothetical protein Ct9H90mP16_18910 [Candidatus Poseidoniales archaeon]